MARVRLILLAAVTGLCAAGSAGAAPALAGTGAAHSTSAHSRSTHRHARCARRAARRVHGHSFRSRRTARCARRHATRHTHTHTLTRSTTSAPAPHAPARGSSAADNGGHCVDASLAPSQQNIERVRAAVVCLINRERAGHGEAAVQPNSRLARAAQSHTESMAFGNYFEHVGPHGDTPLDRMRSCGYIYSPQIGFEVGENIGWGTGWQGTPRAIVAAWMASPGHRANILNPRYRDTAVGVSPHPPSGVAHGQAGGIYTQDFGVITG